MLLYFLVHCYLLVVYYVFWDSFLFNLFIIICCYVVSNISKIPTISNRYYIIIVVTLIELIGHHCAFNVNSFCIVAANFFVDFCYHLLYLSWSGINCHTYSIALMNRFCIIIVIYVSILSVFVWYNVFCCYRSVLPNITFVNPCKMMSIVKHK